MNKTRTFLISGLATMTLIITLFETGFLNLESQPLIAQEDASGLTLEKDGEQVLIPLEEWVVVSSAYDPSNTVRGLYMGLTVDALRIQEKGESLERDIPIDEISSIFTGKTKTTKEYVNGGVKFGCLTAAAVGLIVVILEKLFQDMGIQTEDGTSVGPMFSIVWSPLLQMFIGFVTVPAGGIIGYMRGQAAQGNAVEYVIGDGEWVIVK